MIDTVLMQFGGGEGIWGTVIWFLLFLVFMLFGPRLMITQTIWKLEKDVMRMELIDKQARDIVFKKVGSKGREIKKDVEGFMNFFAIPPVNLDPYGVIKKMDLIIRQADDKFKYFVEQIAPDFSYDEKKNLKNTLAGAMTTHQIAKIVRHNLEIIKKYKIFQLGMLLQMQMPMIEDIAKSSLNATKAFAEELPIGDSVGPLVAARMIPAKAKVNVYEDEDFAVAETKIAGRKVWIAKANGPGATIGFPGKFLVNFFKKHKFNRIITVDAAMRMEGEKPGSIAEGIGIAMGGFVERYQIEEVAVKYKIPIDAVAIKVNQEEALGPMIKEVLDAVPKAIEIVKENIRKAKKGEKILIMGVGNTCGVGNNISEAKKAEETIKKANKKIEDEKNKKKKKKWF
ncbi:MAG: DUF1512 family protein [Candidatus Aenigmarchaeota archaeon]|nr:DUF1512 family protein [Candidatus Aenigmarchaeota archaeon]